MTVARYIGVLAAVGLLAGCATSGANYVPVVDGPVGPGFQSDLAACQQLAASQARVDEGTAASAAAGAGVAAVVAALFDDDNIGEAAAAGATGAVVSDQFGKTAEREAIVKSCMRGRGHNVVG